MKIEPRPTRVRAGQVITRTHQRLIDLAIDSLQDDVHIGMPDLVSDVEDQERINGTPNFEVQDDGIIKYIYNINIMAFPDEVIQINKQTGHIVPLRNIVCGPIEQWNHGLYQTMELQSQSICIR
jgi:hypothetical protein